MPGHRLGPSARGAGAARGAGYRSREARGSMRGGGAASRAASGAASGHTSHEARNFIFGAGAAAGRVPEPPPGLLDEEALAGAWWLEARKARLYLAGAAARAVHEARGEARLYNLGAGAAAGADGAREASLYSSGAGAAAGADYRAREARLEGPGAGAAARADYRARSAGADNGVRALLAAFDALRQQHLEQQEQLMMRLAVLDNMRERYVVDRMTQHQEQTQEALQGLTLRLEQVAANQEARDAMLINEIALQKMQVEQAQRHIESRIERLSYQMSAGKCVLEQLLKSIALKLDRVLEQQEQHDEQHNDQQRNDNQYSSRPDDGQEPNVGQQQNDNQYSGVPGDSQQPDVGQQHHDDQYSGRPDDGQEPNVGQQQNDNQYSGLPDDSQQPNVGLEYSVSVNPLSLSNDRQGLDALSVFTDSVYDVSFQPQPDTNQQGRPGSSTDPPPVPQQGDWDRRWRQLERREMFRQMQQMQQRRAREQVQLAPGIRCFRCNGLGHKVADCPDPRPRLKPSGWW